MPFFVLLLCLTFFLTTMMVGVMRARREKEKFWYLPATISLLGALFSVSIYLEKPLLMLLFGTSTILLGIVGWPKRSRLMEREYPKMLDEVDSSTPLRVRDLGTWKAWLVMASRWGVWKTVLLRSLLIGVISGVLLSIASLFGIMSMTHVVIYTIINSILSAVLLYRRFSKSPSPIGDLNEK